MFVILSFILFVMYIPVYASSLTVPKVKVRIESFDNTIASGEETAFTFLEAIQKFGDHHDINIVISQAVDDKSIYRINDIPNNKFNQNDKWDGFLIRDDKVVENPSIFNQTLKQGDQLVVYYGVASEIKKIPSLVTEEKDGNVCIKALNTYTTWQQKETFWQPEVVVEKLKDVRVHITAANNEEMVGVTNEEGEATFALKKTGFVTCYAEEYQEDAVPLLVKTDVQSFLWGVENKKELTRGEVIAILMNNLNLPQKNTTLGTTYFSDVSTQQKQASEINLAASLQIIKGYADKTFRPNNKISLLECATILSTIYMLTPHEALGSEIQAPVKDVPSWAEKNIQLLMAKHILTDIPLNWNKNISGDTLYKMIQNMNNNL